MKKVLLQAFVVLAGAGALNAFGCSVSMVRDAAKAGSNISASNEKGFRSCIGKIDKNPNFKKEFIKTCSSNEDFAQYYSDDCNKAAPGSSSSGNSSSSNSSSGSNSSNQTGNSGNNNSSGSDKTCTCVCQTAPLGAPLSAPQTPPAPMPSPYTAAPMMYAPSMPIPSAPPAYAAFPQAPAMPMPSYDPSYGYQQQQMQYPQQMQQQYPQSGYGGYQGQ